MSEKKKSKKWLLALLMVLLAALFYTLWFSWKTNNKQYMEDTMIIDQTLISNESNY